MNAWHFKANLTSARRSSNPGRFGRDGGRHRWEGGRERTGKALGNSLTSFTHAASAPWVLFFYAKPVVSPKKMGPHGRMGVCGRSSPSSVNSSRANDGCAGQNKRNSKAIARKGGGGGEALCQRPLEVPYLPKYYQYQTFPATLSPASPRTRRDAVHPTPSRCTAQLLMYRFTYQTVSHLGPIIRFPLSDLALSGQIDP